MRLEEVKGGVKVCSPKFGEGDVVCRALSKPNSAPRAIVVFYEKGKDKVLRKTVNIGVLTLRWTIA